MSGTLRTIVSSLALCACTIPASAAEWKQEFAPYVWASGMEGRAGIGGVTADASLGFSDILDNLEMGFMGGYRASKDRYSIAVDAIYMGLGMTQHGKGGLLKADADMDQVGLETDFGYSLTDRWSVLAGLRYVALDLHVKVTGPLGETRSAREKQDWVDPVVGAQYVWPFAEQWTMTLRGDIGGFGVGSDFAWQGMAVVRWQVTPRTGVALAYRYLDINYDNGSGSDRFLYDVATSGPALGVVFTF